MIWTQEQAKALTDRALAMSKAEETFVALNGGDRANVRFARNTATTSGATSGYSLAITASFGKRSGTVTTAEFDDASLQRAVRNAEEIARLSPENPEAMPVLGPQTYAPVEAYFDDVADGDAGVARRRRSTTAIDAEQEEGGRLGGLRRDAGARCRRWRARRGCSATTASPRPTTTSPRARRTAPARAGRRSRSTSCACSTRRSSRRRPSTRRRARRTRGDRARQVHRRARAGRGGRPARVHAVLGRRAAGRRGAQLLREEGRRQPRRRADRRREGPHLLGSGAPAGADRCLRQRGAADRDASPGSRRAC